MIRVTEADDNHNHSSRTFSCKLEDSTFFHLQQQTNVN